MLTRLQVDGFKNLRGIDEHFGPFTCVAGPNGAGKSNLFDAIAFLSALAQMPLMDAALSVRGAAARHGDVRNLFHRVGDDTGNRIAFGVEMLIPPRGEDSLGQLAQASMTFLRYRLELRYREDPTVRGMGTLEIVSESMSHVNKTSAKKELPFPHDSRWRDSVVVGRRTSPYISTDTQRGHPRISLHADSKEGKGGGRPSMVAASTLPRTILSTVTNAAEYRTLVLARQEMAGWTQLNLEPSALRAPDAFSALSARPSIAANGAHLPATLYALAHAAEKTRRGGEADLYARIANRLAQLVGNVREVSIDVDEKRELLRIVMTDRRKTSHVASALSDGTLRFLALAVMEADPHSRPLLCIEEPENGMHPLRIPAVIELLGDLAVDAAKPVDAENPLRQVIVNTHSPAVVSCVDRDALLGANEVQNKDETGMHGQLVLRYPRGSWRYRRADPSRLISMGDLVDYLGIVREDAARDRPRVGATNTVGEMVQEFLPTFREAGE